MRRLIMTLVLIGAIPISGSAMTQTIASAREAPLGLWSWRANNAAESRLLMIENDGDVWQATIGSESAPLNHDQGEISVVHPDGSSFVGQLSADRSEIRGYWYQPSAAVHYQSVATPTILTAENSGQWRAQVSIQPRPFHVFLDIFEGEDAQILAVIRNPEGNDTLGASRFRLVANEADDNWTLVAGSGGRERRHDLRPADGGALVLEYDHLAKPITLRPATGAIEAKYYSRRDTQGSIALASPPQQDDGWVVATPEEAGFDSAALEALTRKLATADPRNRRPQMIHSLLVARGGKLVFEEYFFGHDRNMRHDVRSAGKVFGSVMIGALQQKGHAIDAAHRPIPEILENAGQAIDDKRKADITLGHLMTFTSGLDCDANSDSIGSESRMWEQQDETDYWLYTARLPMLHDPGNRYAYCSGSANLVGASLAAAGGTTVYDLFDRLIAKPLKFGPYHWALAPNGEGYLGGGAYMRPRDILKIGAMFAANGAWNGNQIIDEAWVKESTAPKVAISAQTTGMSPEQFGNNYFGGSQAYIWRTDVVKSGETSYRSYEASGNGGQLLIIVPELDLVVGFTGGNYRMGGIWGRWRDQIVGGHIIAAMTDAR
ncbi:serine hydrolase domain-containing protein [Parasphingorhabdus sp.]|uniref:serine hydrolase domain-containing protein n=1 Tax=Parasphingorhabdus sp. TaxID=2709688 RepID=UPI003D2CE664